MGFGDGTGTTPQFETAEFQAKPGTDTCSVCNQKISGTYFRINDQMACSACTERLKYSIPKDSHAAFARAVTFGAVAAIAGLVLYAGFGIVTGLMIGYVSLAVGWLVGKAMMKASGGLGGRRYQIVAVLFTYAAVSMAAIPMAIAGRSKENSKKEDKKSAATTPAQTPRQSDNASPQSPAAEGGQAAESKPNSQAAASNSDDGATGTHMSFWYAIGYLAILGLASPFLELASSPVNGLIGLVILFVGLRIAWQLTRGHPPLVVDGPF
jgi:hypothetical protein